jgi:MFS family permease
MDPMRVSEPLKYYSVQLSANLAVAATRLFLPNLAKSLGSTNTQIGVIGAVSNLTVFISTLIFSRRTDIEGSKRYLPLGLLFSAITVGALYLSDSFTSLLSLFSLAGFAMGMYPSTLIAYVFGKRVRLGKFSSMGSLGAGLGLLAAGYIADQAPLPTVFLFGAFFFLGAFIISTQLPSIPQVRHKVPLFPTQLLKQNASIFIPYLIRHLAANIVWIIYPLYLQQLGLDFLSISLLYMLNPFIQFILMYTITDRVSAYKLMALGLLFSTSAFFVMFLSSTPWHIVPVQLLIAASWSCLYVGALRQVTEKDVRKATTTGLLTSIINIGNITGPLIGGFVSEFTGSNRDNMLIATILTLSTIPLYLRFHNPPVENEKPQ